MGTIGLIRQFVQSVILIMLLGTFLQIILPTGGTKKYAQLVLGLVMMLTLLSPLLWLLRGPIDLQGMLVQASDAATWSELQVTSQLLRQKNDQALLHAYSQALTEQVRQLLGRELIVTDCRFRLVLDQTSEEFGKILGLEVDLVASSQPTVSSPVTTVRPVQIGQGSSDDLTVAPTVQMEKRAQEARKLLAERFVVSADDVVVNIRQGGE